MYFCVELHYEYIIEHPPIGAKRVQKAFCAPYYVKPSLAVMPLVERGGSIWDLPLLRPPFLGAI